MRDRDPSSLEDARLLEALLPRLMQSLFSADPDHISSEIPLAQLRVCTLLQAGPRTASSLSDELGISASAITQVVDRLERAEMVERITGEEDRRQKELRLTTRGDEMMRARRRGRVLRVGEALAQLSSGERQQVLDAVKLLHGAALKARRTGEPEESH